MATEMYFEGILKDQHKGAEAEMEMGTTSFLGKGPQLYINFGDHSMILDHETASQLCSAFQRIGVYFGYEPKE